MSKIKALNELAIQRGQSLAELSLAWLLHHEYVTSVIVGASSVQQLTTNLKALNSPGFDESEMREIEQIVQGNML